MTKTISFNRRTGLAAAGGGNGCPRRAAHPAHTDEGSRVRGGAWFATRRQIAEHWLGRF